jgi:transcriptional regulator with XRE-family HTH domain
LRRHRRAIGLTQAELAEQAHLSERAISDLERGLKNPQRATVRLLIRALGLLPDQAGEFEALARHSSPTASDPANGIPVRRGTNLPIHLRPLIGRAHDSEGVCRALLADQGCLVTLVGPGGVGKPDWLSRWAMSFSRHRPTESGLLIYRQ